MIAEASSNKVSYLGSMLLEMTFLSTVLYLSATGVPAGGLAVRDRRDLGKSHWMMAVSVCLNAWASATLGTLPHCLITLSVTFACDDT